MRNSPTLDHLKNGIKRHGVVVVAEYENGGTSTSEGMLMLLECTQHTVDVAMQKLREVRALNTELREALTGFVKWAYSLDDYYEEDYEGLHEVVNEAEAVLANAKEGKK